MSEYGDRVDSEAIPVKCLTSNMRPQVWFEMVDVKDITYQGDEWTPLWIYEVKGDGDMFFAPYVEEIYRVRTLFAPLINKARLFDRWLDMDPGMVYPCVDRGHYCRPGVYYLDSRMGDVGGEYPVFAYVITGGKTSGLQINQDFLAALKLVPQDDGWVRPCEANLEVVKVKKSEDGEVRGIWVKTECLRDYLCARGMGLYIEEFRHRQVNDVDGRRIAWDQSPVVECRSKNDGSAQYEWKGWMFKHSDRHAWKDVQSVDREVLSGSQYYRVEGQLWKQIWIKPASKSGRVAGEDLSYEYYVLPDGTQHEISPLDDDEYGHIYLFFRIDLVRHICAAGARISWEARDVFKVVFLSGQHVLFGISKRGSCFCISADIARLESWEQCLVHGDNIIPEPQEEYVECELFQNQMMCEFLNTHAPENEFPKLLDEFNLRLKKKLGFPLLRDVEGLRLSPVSRFCCADQEGYVFLAKQITKVLIERMDSASLRKVINGQVETKQLGSIGLFSAALKIMDTKQNWDAYIGFMRDVNYIRQVDAHLMSDEDVTKRICAIPMPLGISWLEKGTRLIEYVNRGLKSFLQVL